MVNLPVFCLITSANFPYNNNIEYVPSTDPKTKNKTKIISKLKELNAISMATIVQKNGIANMFNKDKIMPVKKEFRVLISIFFCSFLCCL
ncbi:MULTISPECIES: hypothetical protein [Polaribacter]|uniref:Uncharacterized protein n=1 Tax=Polaribacter marinaquae TaxID=1642819 RepID=A0ABZ2TSM0_9FLAO